MRILGEGCSVGGGAGSPVIGVKRRQRLRLPWKPHSEVVSTWEGQGGRPGTLSRRGSREPRTGMCVKRLVWSFLEVSPLLCARASSLAQNCLLSGWETIQGGDGR